MSDSVEQANANALEDSTLPRKKNKINKKKQMELNKLPLIAKKKKQISLSGTLEKRNKNSARS